MEERRIRRPEIAHVGNAIVRFVLKNLAVGRCRDECQRIVLGVLYKHILVDIAFVHLEHVDKHHGNQHAHKDVSRKFSLDIRQQQHRANGKQQQAAQRVGSHHRQARLSDDAERSRIEVVLHSAGLRKDFFELLCLADTQTVAKH